MFIMLLAGVVHSQNIRGLYDDTCSLNCCLSQLTEVAPCPVTAAHLFRHLTPAGSCIELAQHSVAFATACLAISKDAGVVPRQHIFNHWPPHHCSQGQRLAKAQRSSCLLCSSLVVGDMFFSSATTHCNTTATTGQRQSPYSIAHCRDLPILVTINSTA